MRSATRSKSIRILLAEDHRAIRQAVETLLQNEPDFEVVGSVDNGKRAVGLAAKVHPNVVLMDMGLPEMDGIQATREVCANDPQCRVLCFTMHDNNSCIQAAFEAGATGYLLKEAASEELFGAIRTVSQGSRYLSSSLRGGGKYVH